MNTEAKQRNIDYLKLNEHNIMLHMQHAEAAYNYHLEATRVHSKMLRNYSDMLRITEQTIQMIENTEVKS